MRKAAKGKTMKKGTIETIRIPLPLRRVQEKIIVKMDNREMAIKGLEKKIKRTRDEENKLISKYMATGT